MPQRHHFYYTDADVIANREGKLTDAQRNDLIRYLTTLQGAAQ